jgi:hypothetical protein
MIILICNYFKDEKTSLTNLEVDYAVNEILESIVVPTGVHPSKLGAQWNSDIGEWVLYD